MDKFVEAEILATCNALGIVIRGVYEKGSDCLNCLKDLLRYLKKDDETHSVLRFLGHTNVLENDLLPLLKRYEDDREIFDFTLRLIVALTSPALLLFQEEIPEDKISNNIYLQLVNYLQSYKRAFCDLEVWNALYRQLAKLLEMRRVERSEEDGLILERILVMIRNILHVPTHEFTSIQTDDDISPQDRIIQNIHLSKVDVLFLYMCANEDEYNYCLHMIEMISLMLREHLPETLASTNEQRTGQEKEKDMDALMVIRQREQNMKLKKVQSMVSARFSGVYCVKNMKSLSNNDYISHKFITNLDDVKFDEKKTSKKIPKNRVPLKDINCTRRSTLSIRLFLKKFCKEFLNSYNKFISAVGKELQRKASTEHDDTYYLWATEYFMKFNRLSDFQPALVSETISMQMFHHIQTQITNYKDMMDSDKKKSGLWSKRMRLGVSTYKELLQTVFSMTKSKDTNIRENADIIVSNVFYVSEYREMLLSLLSNYDEVKFSLTYLSELIESTYMFLKMLENHSKRHSEIIIQKRKKKVRRRKKKKPVESQTPVSIDLEEDWTDLAGNLSAAVQNRRNITADSFPFDGASDVPFEEQKIDAMYKIRHALVSKQAEQAVSLLRSARDLWPNGDSFGAPDIDSEDEFLVLREIYLSNLENPHPENNPKEEQDSRDETDEEMAEMPAMIEQQLDLDDIYKRYATLKIVQPCCLLLANYQNNSSQTNVSLIKLLHRIAWDCKMHALFFQSTVFLTFQKICHDPDISTNPVTKELYRFAKFILSKFFAVVQQNDKVFVEMLFWKGCKEAYELEEGYGTSDSNMKGAWSEKEEDELRELYEENKDIHIEGQDVADIICASIENRKRTKHQIILALKRLGLIQSAKDLKPHLRKNWKEDEVTELQNLFQDFKGSDDIMGSILNGLSIKRSRKAVVEKMLELNIIQDHKEVLKKKSKKSKKADGSVSDADSFMENSEDEDQVVPYSSTNRKPGEDSSENEDEENFFKQLKAQRIENQNAVSQVDSNDVYGSFELQTEETVPENSNSKKTSKNVHHREPKRSKGLPEVWQEQEIMELSTLFNNNRDSEDIMDVIINSMTVKKTRQSIVEKLLEVGLIKDKKEVRKKKTSKKNNSLDVSEFVVGESKDEDSENESSVNMNTIKKKLKKARQILSDSEDDLSNDINADTEIKTTNSEIVKKKLKKTTSKSDIKKRAPKVWEEKEIIELQHLFQKYTGAPDIIGSILSELTVKRSKEGVIEKLLEIRLIEDRKEIRKRRQKQDKTPKQNKKDKLNNEMGEASPSIIKNQSKIEKKKKKAAILSDSSEDETIPLNKIATNSTNIVRKSKKVAEISSDDEDLLLTSALNKNDRVNNSIESGNVPSPIANSLSETDDLFNNLVNDHTGLSSNQSSQKRKNDKILSDSSDDDMLPLSIIGKKEHLLSSATINNVESDEEKDMPSFLKSDEPSAKPRHKRKRLVIDDSDESEDDISALENNLETPSQLSGNDIEENASVNRSKKRARVLLDSDDSN